MPPTGQQIAVCARSWIGTRFAHQGRVKKSPGSRGGCDCIGLIIGVAAELDISCKGIKLASLDPTGYGKSPDGEFFKQKLDKYLYPADEEAEGDIVLFRIKRLPQHVGIAARLEDGSPSLIHAYAQARGVVEHRFDDFWWERAVARYQLSVSVTC